MEVLQSLFHGKGYIDGITIINLEGEILFSAKLNSKFSGQEELADTVGKRFLEVFENLNPQNSTMMRAMETGLPFYVENQTLKSRGQEEILISSISIPIKSGGRVVGAIDLSVREMGEEEEAENRVSLEDVHFPVAGVEKMRGRSKAAFTVADIIGEDEKMRRAKEYVPIVAACDLPVMIYGETGTGKEMFAQAIHNAGPRREKPFIVQNCAALPDTLLESILFGTSRGAFTGAVENKGLFELADGGTLFLDEINSMPLHLQSKLLRVLQDGSFRSLGARELKHVDVKIIAALNTEPVSAIEKGELRRDIYYRLSMMSITIPPLRERKGDIDHFVKFYVNKHNATFGKNVRYVSADLLKRLREYDWPGNVRELEHMIVYGMSMAAPDSSVLRFEDIQEKWKERAGKRNLSRAGEADLPQAGEADLPRAGKVEFLRAGKKDLSRAGKKDLSQAGEAASPPEKEEISVVPLREAVERYERDILVRILEKTGGNISEAARILDIPRQTLQRKIKEHGIGRKPEGGK